MRLVIKALALLLFVSLAASGPHAYPMLPRKRSSVPPTVRAVGTSVHGTAAITLSLPSGTATNDLLVAMCKTQDQVITITDWTELFAYTNADRITVFYRLYSGAENLITSDSGLENSCIVIGITAGTFNSVTPFPNTPTTSNGTTTTCSTPTLTTTVNNSLVVTGCVGPSPDAAGTNEYSGWANAALASADERVDWTTATSNGGSMGVATGLLVTAGATGATTSTTATSTAKAEFTFAVAAP